VANIVDKAKGAIRTEAAEGVKPYVLASIALSLVALYYATRRKRRR
jgi:hypothetical protein